MKRILTFLLIIFGLFFVASKPSFSNNILRSYDEIELATGTFIPVISAQTISTELNDTNDSVKFIVRNDLYLQETKIIPEGSYIYGHIAKINEPVIGTNAALVIKIDGIVFQDGFQIPIRGYIYTPRNNLIGGELTKPKTYDKMPHYQEGMGMGTLQYVPGQERTMGKHTVIASGAELMVILTKPAFITHIMAN